MKDEMLKDTPIGTVIRKEWKKGYLKLVKELEMECRRPVCGAKKKNGRPCKGRPTEEFGYYCALHRHNGEYNHGVLKSPVRLRSELMRKEPPLLLRSEVHAMLTRCENCPIRNRCSEFVVGHYCRVEERLFERFMVTAKSDYELDALDEYSLVQAGFAFVNSFRGQMAMSQMTPQEAEETRVGWIQPRHSKDFRDTMKSLGLSRKERLDRESDKLGVSKLPGSTSLAQIMSEIDLSEVTLHLKRKSEKEFIDVPVEEVE